MQKLIKMFSKRVQSIKLLFQASKQNFSMEKYYEVCGSQTHTLIVTLTNKDKIFGGYTPFCFWDGKEEGYVNDAQK